MDFIKPTLWMMGASLALAACAVVPPPEYASDHPANAAAPAAPEPRTPSALATYKSFSMGSKPEPGHTGGGVGKHLESGDLESGDRESPAQESGHDHAH